MEKQVTINECCEIPYINNVTSLNLRKGRREEKKLKEPIPYRCSVCGQKRSLGKNSAVLARISYNFHNMDEEYVLCDDCLDVFADAIQNGPRVLAEGNKWKLFSRVARISLVQEYLFCFRCQGRSDTHVFVKFDNLRIGGKESYNTMRVCSRCVVSYLQMMKELQCTVKNKYTHVCPSQFPDVMVQKSTTYAGALFNGE